MDTSLIYSKLQNFDDIKKGMIEVWQSAKDALNKEIEDDDTLDAILEMKRTITNKRFTNYHVNLYNVRGKVQLTKTAHVGLEDYYI